MSGADTRSRNLPGSFDGFLSESRNSETDPLPTLRSAHCHGFFNDLPGKQVVNARLSGVVLDNGRCLHSKAHSQTFICGRKSRFDL